MNLQPWPDFLLAELTAARISSSADTDRTLDDLGLPPSSQAVVELLDRMPNPLHVTRDEYLSVMLGAKGCIDALENAGVECDAGAIGDAAARWAMRWEGYDGTDEHARWADDFATRTAPLAGWRHLEQHARRLIPAYAAEQAEADFAGAPLPAETPAIDRNALRDFLSADAWLDRDVPDEDRLLGDLITTTTRTFLVGKTGLGKTQLALAIAIGMASGRGFMHWRSHRAARVLIVDGEMPAALIKQRMQDAIQRAGVRPDPTNLILYARDLEDEFARRFPQLGRMDALNTPAGRAWLLAFIDALGGVDVVIFDNVMSLVAGDQKDEVSWTDTTPLVHALTARRIGQLWLDHTPHEKNRQYGSATKAWRFDAVGIMSPVAEERQVPGETAFTLSFDDPGKARRRTPANWQDFATRTFRLTADGWTTDAATRREGKLAPNTGLWFAALRAAAAAGNDPNRVTTDAWFAEAAKADLVAPDGGPAQQARLRKARGELRRAGLIHYDMASGVVTILGSPGQPFPPVPGDASEPREPVRTGANRGELGRTENMRFLEGGEPLVSAGGEPGRTIGEPPANRERTVSVQRPRTAEPCTYSARDGSREDRGISEGQKAVANPRPSIPVRDPVTLYTAALASRGGTPDKGTALPGARHGGQRSSDRKR